MNEAPSYPLVLYPEPLRKALAARPERKVFREDAPAANTFAKAVPERTRASRRLLRFVGLSRRVDSIVAYEKAQSERAYRHALRQFQKRKASFERSQDQRFTEAALRDYRRPRVMDALEASVREDEGRSFAPEGAAEFTFWTSLKTFFPGYIHRKMKVTLEGTEYHPDFTFYDPATRLRIDIELDEPYGAKGAQKAIHYVALSEVQQRYVSVDEGRDQAFLEGGWVVVRFAESQVATDPAGCCRTLAEVVKTITGRTFQALQNVAPVDPTPRWTREQANLWSDQRYRDTFSAQLERETKSSTNEAPKTFSPSLHQQAIYTFVRSGAGHGLIVAVAGSGKSTTLLGAARAAKDVSPSARVLFLAFNIGIAKELDVKVRERGFGGEVEVATLNAFGQRVITKSYGRPLLKEKKYTDLLREAASNLDTETGRAQNRKILKNGDDLARARRLLDLYRSYRDITLSDVESFKRRAESYAISGAEQLHPIVVEALALGVTELEEKREIDFGDQCFLPIHLNLPIDPYDFVFVDECQDLTQTQLDLVCRAAGPKGRILFVGDPMQAIMGFRFADNDSVRNIANLPQKPTELDLTVSYRCPSSHIKLAQELYPAIEAAPGAEEGEVIPIKWDELSNHAREGDLMFARKNDTVKRAVLELVANGHTINYKGIRRKKIKDPQEREEQAGNKVADLMRKVQNEAENFLPTEAPKPRVSDKDVIDAMISWVLSRLQKEASKQGRDFNEFVLSRTAPDSRFGITVCSAHQAKGLEAERVFVLDSYALGKTRQDNKEWEKEQERNLKYVAYTRSKRTMYLVNG